MGNCPSSSVDNLDKEEVRTDGQGNMYGNDVMMQRIPISHEDKKEWVRKNIHIKRCCCYIKNKAQGKCYCGFPKRSHAQGALEKGKKIKTWDESFIVTLPTDFYHEFPSPVYENPGHTISTKCVRMDIETPMKTVSQFLFDIWELRQPHLVISIIGGSQNQIKDRALLDEIRMGLKRIVGIADVWLISDGLNRGVVKYVETGLNDDDSSSTLETIGVAYSGDTYIPKDRRTLQRRNTWRLSLCRTVKMADSIEFDDARNDGKAQLDFNHKYVILVDDGKNDVNGNDVEYEFRGNLDQQLKYYSNENGDEYSLPLVEILLEGKLKMLSTVLSSVTCGIPVVVVKGTGGLADIIAYAVQNAIVEEDVAPSGSPKRYVFSIPVETRLRELINGMRNEVKTEQEVMDILKNLHHVCATGTSNLIKIFDMKSSASTMFDIEVFKAILGGSRCERKEQLYSKVVLTSLQQKSLDLIAAFLSEPSLVWNFITDEQILDLYKYSLGADAVLKPLMKKKFKQFSISNLTKDPQQVDRPGMEAYFVSNIHLTNFKLEDLDMLLKDMLGDFFSSWYEHIDTEGNRYVLEQLFLWAVLTDNFDISKMIWQKAQDPVASALVASGILQALSNRSGDTAARDRLRIAGQEYSQLAINLLNKCYDNDRRNTIELLEKHMPFWGKTTCAMVAMETNNGHFVAQTACKKFSNNVWMGGISGTTSVFKILICIVLFFLPILIPALIDFVPKHKRGKKEQDPDQTCPYANEKGPETDRKSDRQRFLDKMRKFYKAPIVKFYTSVILYFIFLGLFSYLLIVEFGEKVSVVEIIITLWIASIFLEEIWQVIRSVPSSAIKKIKKHMSNVWNKIDLFVLVLFATGLGLRYSSYIEAARVIFAVTLAMFFLRVLHIFSISKALGPQLVMMGKMLNDLFVFMVIIMIYVSSYSIAAYSLLYPNSEPEWRLVLKVLRIGYWPLYGELLLDDTTLEEPDCSTNVTIYQSGDLPRCPSAVGQNVVPIMLGIYVLISNILLLNLLIAIFAFSVQKVYEYNDVHWSFQSFELVFEYHLRVPLPPPLTLLLWIMRLLVPLFLFPCICKTCCTWCFPSLGKTRTCSFDRDGVLNKFLAFIYGTNKNKFLAEDDQIKPESVIEWEKQILSSNIGVQDVKLTEETDTGNKQLDTITSSVDEIETEIVVIKKNTTVLPAIVDRLARIEKRLNKFDKLFIKPELPASGRTRHDSSSSSDSLQSTEA